VLGSLLFITLGRPVLWTAPVMVAALVSIMGEPKPALQALSEVS
jgi:hypothetical protein